MNNCFYKQTAFLKLLLVAAMAVFISGCGSHLYHKVRIGDTLYSISFRYGQDYRQIAKWNGIKAPYILHRGEWVRIVPPEGSWPYPDARRQIKNEAAPAVKPDKGSVLPDDKAEELRQVDWQWPVKGKVVNQFHASGFGKKGIDIINALGTPVYAAASGRAVYSGQGLRGYGNLIILKHSDKLLSAYAHNQKIVIQEGQAVKKGQLIAYMGKSGAERVKLHFEIRVDGIPVDPLGYLPR